MKTILTRLAAFRTSALLGALLLAACTACHGTGCH